MRSRVPLPAGRDVSLRDVRPALSTPPSPSHPRSEAGAWARLESASRLGHRLEDIPVSSGARGAGSAGHGAPAIQRRLSLRLSAGAPAPANAGHVARQGYSESPCTVM
jgi:hypothetical protein